MPALGYQRFDGFTGLQNGIAPGYGFSPCEQFSHGLFRQGLGFSVLGTQIGSQSPMSGQNKFLPLVNPIKDCGEVGLGVSSGNCVHEGKSDLLRVILSSSRRKAIKSFGVLQSLNLLGGELRRRVWEPGFMGGRKETFCLVDGKMGWQGKSGKDEEF